MRISFQYCSSKILGIRYLYIDIYFDTHRSKIYPKIFILSLNPEFCQASFELKIYLLETSVLLTFRYG